MVMTAGEIADLLGVKLDDGFRGMPVKRLLTDSRSLGETEATLFFAISTPSTDATRFMRQLYDKGLRLFIAPQHPESMTGLEDAVVMEYPDPVGALQKIASRRGDAGGEVVAITGSAGKTTVKEFIFQLMSGLRKMTRSPRSYNSQIGVPLSMWGIRPDTELTLIEAGVSRSGEMARLAECIKPDTVIVTGMSEEHSDGFPSYGAKIAEKVSLAAYPGVRRIIYCADDTEVAHCVASLPEDVERFPWSFNPDSDARLVITSVKYDVAPGGWCELSYRAENISGTLKVRTGSRRDLPSVCCALAFIVAEGMDAGTISDRFSRLHPVETRLSVSDGRNGNNVIFDSYTSDFTSLPPAVDFMMRRKMPRQNSVVILSDFAHEEGDNDDYSAVASLLRERGVGRLIGVGPNLRSHSRIFDRSDIFFSTSAELAEWLKENPIRNSCVLVKGSPENDLSHIRELLEVRTHETLLEVNLDAMIRNYNYFRSHVPASTGMVAMVKASGYGAGSYEIAKTLQDAGAAYLAVAVLDEGLDLRRQGITMPVMVMNPRVADYVEMFSNRLEPEIYTFGMLEDVIHQARLHGVKDYPIHVKLDTGMHRMGFVEEELPALMESLRNQSNVRISSVFSHLATADCPDMDDYTERQLATFERCSSYMLSQSGYMFKRHILNSAGILRFPQYHYDMVRLGIGLYGVNTLPPEMERPLDVVSTLRTNIINLREWKAGESIGYARRGMLGRDSRVATIPIGYADGMNRHFGNGAIKVLVNGIPAPTIGNICMDACMIDVTGIDCRIGDTVEIFGRNAPVGRLSDALDTIPYEILTSVSPRVKRVYYRE